MQIREGWYVGFGALLGAAGAILGLLMLLNIAPDNAVDVGAGLVLVGVSRVVP